MNPTLIPGLVRIRSRHSVEEVLARLTALLDTNGVKLFAVIDHSGEAAEPGSPCPRPRWLSSAIPRPARRSWLPFPVF